jgi:alanyl-tRNA synthetase
VRYADRLGITEASFAKIVKPVIEMYEEQYPELQSKASEIESAIASEEEKFRSTLTKGTKEFDKITHEQKTISGSNAFILFSTYGFPLELTLEIAQERGIDVDIDAFKKEMEKHQDLSRAGSEQKFKGGLADTEEKTVRLHTAHHLLLKALQIVLGPQVKQRGSNITQERLRIDFSHGEKVTKEQLAEVEQIVNEKIDEDLPVIRSEMAKEDAEKLGAEHEFGQKYPDRVSIYSVGPKDATLENPQFENVFSIEFCGGPHVTHTGKLGEGGHMFKIQKEEAVSAGVRRIKAVLE